MKLQKEKVLDNFRAMLRIKTVSGEDSLNTREEFARFRALLKERYGAVFACAKGWRVGEYGVLIRLEGRAHDRPSVLMAHMDVVPADDGWESDPFGAALHGGRVYGRGALDTKCTLLSIMEAVQYCVENGFAPEQDIYLAFGGQEEISGPCMGEIVSFLEELGVYPDFVLDEGGSLIPEGLPGVPGLSAMIGISEKGTATYRVTIEDGRGGHASVPPRSTVAGRIAAAAAAIESRPAPARLSRSVRQMFKALAGETSPLLRPFFAHPELVAPAVCAAASLLGGTFNAMVRSTAAVTGIRSGTADNVLPTQAQLTVNMRLLEGDTLESTAARLRGIVRDPKARVELVQGTDPTGIADVSCAAYARLKDVIGETWPGAVIAPYQMNGGTDARFFERLTDHIYRFTPMIMTKEERASVHGRNESISVGALMRMIVFYIRLIERL